MEKERLYKILSEPFNSNDWLDILHTVFGARELLYQPQKIILPPNDRAEAAYELGNFTTSDDRIIGLYRIELNPDVRLERNKVGLRKLLRNVYKHSVDGAIIVFDQGDNWRLSFVSEIKVLNDDEVVEQVTETRRYTYILGKDKKVKTPSDRLSKLTGKTIALRDILDAFSVETLSKEFYNKLYKWYKKAQTQVIFPNDEQAENHIQTSLIRLLTRLLFIWFLKEKKLINADLFDKKKLKTLIDYDKPSSFYKAILQNLFFATLNRTITKRSFRTTTNGAANNTNYLVTNIYRYQSYFTHENKDNIIELFAQTPFLNGGLFECLDREANDEEKQNYDNDHSIRPVGSAIRIDGFSDRVDNKLVFDNQLFFNDDNDDERDLGLIDLFNQYQFTVEESTPLDVEVALDPELLGKVFENLLASYNPETGQQARKATGSFYTPREIVSYMVDESLKQYFKQHTDLDENQINDLFVDETVQTNTLTEQQIKTIVRRIDSIKILDPAVGSGAYPMGILQRLVFILEKIDSENIYFKQQQLDKAEQMDEASKEASMQAIEQVFSQQNQHNAYGKKLYLIENCIYGVDIQPIAIQICKLRFFISLTIEQNPNQDKNDNYGIKALPNFETKFIVANSLLPLGEMPKQYGMFDTGIEKLQKELAEIRHKYFSAKTLNTKRKYKEKDKSLREKMLTELTKTGITPSVEASMRKIVDWDLYNQNSIADWFDPEWQFGIKAGFDIVIGNPPYIDSESMVKNDINVREIIAKNYVMTKGNWDIYIAFFELGFKSLNPNGVLTFITPDKWIAKPFGYELRKKLINNLCIILNAGRQVFETAKVDSVVTFFTKKCCNSLVILDFEGTKIVFKNEISKSIIGEPFSFDFVFSNYLPLLNKIDLLPARIKDFFECENACSTSDAYKIKPFIENNYNDAFNYKTHLKIINTGTIDKYISKWGIKEMTYLKDKYLNPIVNKKEFLEQFNNSYSTKSTKPKIIIKGLTLLDSCLDDKGIFIPGKSTLIVANNNIEQLKFLLALLNSALVIFYIKEKHPASSYNQGINFTKHMINNMPIPQISKPEQQPFIDLVDKILVAKKLGESTAVLEAKIDEMVYKLYDLSDDEVGIVETNK